jgi:hypothetical protein
LRSSQEFATGVLHFAATGDTSKLPEKVDMPPVEWALPGVEK